MTFPELCCHVTGNPCGTDTWEAGKPCHCPSCDIYTCRLWAESRQCHSDASGLHSGTVLRGMDALEHVQLLEEREARLRKLLEPRSSGPAQDPKLNAGRYLTVAQILEALDVKGYA